VNILLVAIGGALGSVCRYLMSSAVLRWIALPLPAGTFAVNIVGCLLFGAIAGAADGRVMLGQPVRLFLLVGVLGGFTTFSSYVNESALLLREGQLLWGALNLAGQVVSGLAAFWVAFSLTAR
jgi:CrcB protein